VPLSEDADGFVVGENATEDARAAAKYLVLAQKPGARRVRFATTAERTSMATRLKSGTKASPGSISRKPQLLSTHRGYWMKRRCFAWQALLQPVHAILGVNYIAKKKIFDAH
jgi:hypothetical protein